VPRGDDHERGHRDGEAHHLDQKARQILERAQRLSSSRTAWFPIQPVGPFRNGEARPSNAPGRGDFGHDPPAGPQEKGVLPRPRGSGNGFSRTALRAARPALGAARFLF
jgi:hypothetical protein